MPMLMDALNIAKRLETPELSKKVTNNIAAELSNVLNYRYETYATKNDIRNMEENISFQFNIILNKLLRRILLTGVVAFILIEFLKII